MPCASPPSCRPYLLVASDMDGTLLNAEHEITPFSKEVLYRVVNERGVPFIFATGRHHLSVRAVRDDLVKFFSDKQSESGNDNKEQVAGGGHVGFYIVSSNGARAHDERGNLVLEHNLDPAVVAAVYREFCLPYTRKRYAGPPGTASPAMPCSPVVLTENGEYVTAGVVPRSSNDDNTGGCPRSATDEDTVHKGGDEPDDVVSSSAYTTEDWFMTASSSDEDMRRKFGFVPNVCPFDTHDERNVGRTVFDSFPTEGVGKVCLRSSNRGILSYLEKTIKERFGDEVSVAMSSNCCLDVMRGGVSKAAALRELAAKLTASAPGAEAITMDRLIAFGDSMNDREMLEAVGKGCLMVNAQQRLKKALPQCEVIAHHEENGVAQKLLEVFQLE